MKKIIHSILIVGILFLFNNQIIYANGAPGDSAGNVEGGNIEFKSIEEINLVEEKLDIILKEKQVNVRVEYFLENQGEELETEYIFPVTLRIDEFSDFGSVDNFSMYDGDNKLDYSVLTGDKALVEYYYERTDNYVSSLHFMEGETKKLTIEYSVTPEYLDWSTSKSPFPRYGDKYFSYDLAPAANWGDGIIDNFQLVLDVSEILEKGGSVIETTFNGLDLTQNTSVYKVENFDIISNSKLSFRYEVSDYLLNQFIDSHNALAKVYKISSSSTLDTEKYGLMNMFDNDLKTCWAEGSEGLGVGDWIEVEFSEPVNIFGVLFTNGLYEDKTSYYDNSRIKFLSIEALLYDSVNGYTNAVYKNNYEVYEYDNVIPNLYTSVSEMQYCTSLVKSFKIIIEDAYAGDKYEDLCISEMLILSDSDLSNPINSIQVEENVGNIIEIIQEEEGTKVEKNEQKTEIVQPSFNNDIYDDTNNNETSKESNDLSQTTDNTSSDEEETVENNKFTISVILTILVIIFVVIIIRKRKNS